MFESRHLPRESDGMPRRVAEATALLRLLDEFHAAEAACADRCGRLGSAVERSHPGPMAAEFRKRAQVAHTQAEILSAWIGRLGGVPRPARGSPPAAVPRGAGVAMSLRELWKEEWVAERMAIDRCRVGLVGLGGDDGGARRALQGILTVNERQAESILDLIVSPAGPGAPSPAAAGFNGGSGRRASLPEDARR
jgi:hypothetical protein